MRRRSPNRVLIIPVVLMILAFGVVVQVPLWFTGATQRYLAQRTLDDFYAAIGRGDYAAASRMAYVTSDVSASEARVREWAIAAGADHGPPVGGRFVYARWGMLGASGYVSYLVRYRDGVEEHADGTILIVFPAPRFLLPGPTLEQQLRACYAPGGATVAFGEARLIDIGDWALAYTATLADGTRFSGIYYKTSISQGDIQAEPSQWKPLPPQCRR